LERPKVKVGDREIDLTDEVLEVLRKYVKTSMTLEQLAAELGLNGWEEAYDLIKKGPSLAVEDLHLCYKRRSKPGRRSEVSSHLVRSYFDRYMSKACKVYTTCFCSRETVK